MEIISFFILHHVFPVFPPLPPVDNPHHSLLIVDHVVIIGLEGTLHQDDKIQIVVDLVADLFHLVHRLPQLFVLLQGVLHPLHGQHELAPLPHEMLHDFLPVASGQELPAAGGSVRISLVSATFRLLAIILVNPFLRLDEQLVDGGLVLTPAELGLERLGDEDLGVRIAVVINRLMQRWARVRLVGNFGNFYDGGQRHFYCGGIKNYCSFFFPFYEFLANYFAIF